MCIKVCIETNFLGLIPFYISICIGFVMSFLLLGDSLGYAANNLQLIKFELVTFGLKILLIIFQMFWEIDFLDTYSFGKIRKAFIFLNPFSLFFYELLFMISGIGL